MREFGQPDVTAADRKRPRVLLLSFTHAAGHNFQRVSRDVILFAPLCGKFDNDVVPDAAMEQQAIGRVLRPGQRRPVRVHRIVLQSPAGGDTVDRAMIRRNTALEVIKAVTSD